MSQRAQQVSELIRHALTEIMSRELELPAGVLITVTNIEVSHDLSYVKVWITITPHEQTGLAYGLIRENLSTLRHELSQKVVLREAPKLRFQIDRAESLVGEVEQLLKKIKEEK